MWQNCSGLLVSLPPTELAHTAPPGSVFGIEHLVSGQVSHELSSAVHLIRTHCERRRVPVTCVVRPEIFASGRPERWLSRNLSGFNQHLAVSDGRTIKPVGGRPTHLFLYRRAHHDSHEAFRQLACRAPELVAQIESQVNSWFSFSYQAARCHPKSVVLMPDDLSDRPRCTFWPFVFNRFSAEDGTNRILHYGSLEAELIEKRPEVCYIPLTTSALQDVNFSHRLAHLVRGAFFGDESLLILGLPLCGTSSDPLREGMAGLVSSLNRTGVVLPFAFSRNIVLSTGDLDEENPLLAEAALQIVVHDSFEFWRHTAKFYGRADRVSVIRHGEASVRNSSLPDSRITAIYGRNAHAIGSSPSTAQCTNPA